MSRDTTIATDPLIAEEVRKAFALVEFFRYLQGLHRLYGWQMLSFDEQVSDAEEALYALIDEYHGPCTCMTDAWDCPSYDVHVRVFFALESIQHDGETGAVHYVS